MPVVMVDTAVAGVVVERSASVVGSDWCWLLEYAVVGCWDGCAVVAMDVADVGALVDDADLIDAVVGGSDAAVDAVVDSAGAGVAAVGVVDDVGGFDAAAGDVDGAAVGDVDGAVADVVVGVAVVAVLRRGLPDVVAAAAVSWEWAAGDAPFPLSRGPRDTFHL